MGRKRRPMNNVRNRELQQNGADKNLELQEKKEEFKDIVENAVEVQDLSENIETQESDKIVEVEESVEKVGGELEQEKEKEEQESELVVENNVNNTPEIYSKIDRKVKKFEIVDLKKDNEEDNEEEKTLLDLSELEQQEEIEKPKKVVKKMTKLQKIISGFTLFFMACIMLSLFVDSNAKEGSLSYIDFLKDVDNGYIDYIVNTNGSPFVDVVYKEGVAQEEVYDPETKDMKKLTIVDNRRRETVLNPSDEDFYKNLALKGIETRISSDSTSALIALMISLIPSIILIGLLIYMLKMQFGNNMNQKSGKLATKSNVKFSDVAGMTEEKEELLFAIKSLNNQEEYVKKGVKPVRGILLEGPPGVGKTMLAKAVAGEAGVNFLSYSGSDFVEMFVGLGARRVRGMFEEAEKLKPCVIFIDEIDALGRKRIAGGNGGTQEADQTLVALLERMDGMNTTSGILFIAATNRIDALDSALLRPGRFDKTIHVSPPKTKEDREAIVRVHSKDKSFAEDVTIEKIAKQCYGLTGAEIASALNDAVLESFKDNRQGIVNLDDIDKAIMKLFAKGLAKGRHNEKDLYRVSVHEVGHALMNKHLGRNVVKVSIQPYSSGVGGVTQIDGESSGLDGVRTKTDIINDIKVLYAGKVAEETILGECSIGASNDLERATYIIRDFIGAYGMQEGNILSLVGLSRENMMIAANETLLENMKEVSNEIFGEVVEYFENSKVKENLEKIAKELCENEVIYDFDSVYEKYFVENEESL